MVRGQESNIFDADFNLSCLKPEPNHTRMCLAQKTSSQIVFNLCFSDAMQVMAAAMTMQRQWQEAQIAQRKAQNAAKAAKRALARVQQMHEDKGL